MSLTSLNVQSRPEWETEPEPADLSDMPLVTGVLIAANVLVFMVMLFRGIPFFDPTPGQLLSAGANFGPLTTSGQWWRLFTACFLHAGIIHLAMNMYILFQIGLLTEALFGRVLFLLLYLIAGLCGNIAGLFLHPLTTSVGASGAIFGLYGGLFAFLLVRRAHIDKERSRPILTNAAIFLGYNLIYGLASPTTDLVAHLGGLVSGFAFGCPLAMVRGPVQHRRPRLSVAVGLSLAALMAVATWKLPRSSSAQGEFYRELSTGHRLSAGASGSLVYAGAVTREEASAVADVLVEMGYYQATGVVALLQRTSGSTTLLAPLKAHRATSSTSTSKSSAENDPAQTWNNPAFVGAFLRAGPKLATVGGGLPFQIRFVNDNGAVMKSLHVDRAQLTVLGKDRVSYSGDITAKDALAVANALRAAGFFKGQGAVVLLSKNGNIPQMIFPIGEDRWDDPKLMADMVQVSARAAGGIGGLAVKVQLVNLTRRQQKTFSLEVPSKK